MYNEYKKITNFSVIVFLSFCLLARDFDDQRPKFDNDEKLSTQYSSYLPVNSFAEKETIKDEDIDKFFLNILIESLLNSYTEIVSITAIHFLQENHDRSSLEIKIFKQIVKGLLKITVETGKYSNKILFSSRTNLEKTKRIGVIVASLVCIHFAVNSLINKQKTS